MLFVICPNYLPVGNLLVLLSVLCDIWSYGGVECMQELFKVGTIRTIN